MTVHLKEETLLDAWDASADKDVATTATDLAHSIIFGNAQTALEAIAAGGAGLTADHAKALHFANEMAEVRHYRPLIAVEDGTPALAPGVRHVIGTFDDLDLWNDQPAWNL